MLLVSPLMPSKFHWAHEARTTYYLKIKGYSVFSGNSYFMGEEDKFTQNETSFRRDKACLIESEAPAFTWQFIFRPLCKLSNLLATDQTTEYLKTHFSSNAEWLSSTRLWYTLYLTAAHHLVIGQIPILLVL